jgi:hypothetical protein
MRSRVYRIESLPAHVLPNHPMFIQRIRSMSRIKSSRDGVAGINIHADAQRSELYKPGRHAVKEPTGNSAPAVFLHHVNPLQFAVATVSACAMTSDEPDQGAVVDCDEGCAVSKGLLRRMLSAEIRTDSSGPEFLSLPHARANGRHDVNIVLFDGPDDDRHMSAQAFSGPVRYHSTVRRRPSRKSTIGW